MSVLSKAENLFRPSTIKKILKTAKNSGFKGMLNKAYFYIKPSGSMYMKWFKQNSVSEYSLYEQRKCNMPYKPKISIVVPVYNTPIEYLNQMIESVLAQSYSNWELCIADASGIDIKFSDKRIIHKVLSKNMGISKNTNDAIDMATGDYIAFLDHDDTIEPDALYEVVMSLQKYKHDVVYTDEDFASEDMKKYSNPAFKPDWSPDLLLSHNYITHFLVINKRLIEKVGKLNSDFDGAQDYDLILRCTEKANSIYHIPKILYHWRMHSKSVAGNPESKMFAYESGKRALEAHLNRCCIEADVELAETLGYYHIAYKTTNNPKVSIIIPNKDNSELLNQCINSLYSVNEYENFEVIIVENNSLDSKTFSLYKRLKSKYKNLSVINYEGDFNYSKINNYAVKKATGDYYLFLNNDTKMINKSALTEMLGNCMRDDVGIVGAKLLHQDNTIQNAGIIIGVGGLCEHVFVDNAKDDAWYKMRPLINCNYSAVSGSCLMIGKNDFKSVNGFSEEYTVTLNDVDLCLKIRERNKLVVYNAFSLWFHYGSKTIKDEDKFDVNKSLALENDLFASTWFEILKNGDPYYNQNFKIDDEPYRIKPLYSSFLYNIDSNRVITKDNKEFAEIRGWAYSFNDSEINFSVLKNRKLVPVKISRKQRPDLFDMGITKSYDGNYGFRLIFEIDKKSKYRVIFSDELETRSINYNYNKLNQDLSRSNKDIEYSRWIKEHEPSERDFKDQRAQKFLQNPLFSIVVPLYKTPKKYLKLLIDSVLKQTYTNWELILSDGSGKDSYLKDYLKKITTKDTRIKYINNEKELMISENTNVALKNISGDFVVFCDHDDLLAPNALFECAVAINENSNIDMIYSDEDKIDFKNKIRFEPHFKSDFNIDMLRSVNYICHLLVVKNSLIKKAGIFNSKYDGAQDYDFVLRCSEKADCIHHIPKVLYHWRSHMNSTAGDSDNKDYVIKSSIKALKDHYKRIGLVTDVSYDVKTGYYKTVYDIKNKPSVSIIIPNKDHIEDLKKCINSLYKVNTYKNFEIIVVENNSEEKITFDEYNKLERKFNELKIVKWNNKGFNFSAINNFGASFASSDYILFLNNDTEMLEPESINNMLGVCMRDDVGAVGAKLYYEDGSIQHAGVIVGILGVAAHVFVNERHNFKGYFGRASIIQDLSAVTAACMMVKKSVFNEVGGFCEDLAVAFNDIDLCLKIREKNYLIVYNPYSQLKHYESKSRGYETSPDKIKRFNSEIKKFKNKWTTFLFAGDPYYNPNLTYEHTNFGLMQ